MNNCWSAAVLAILAVVLVFRIEGTDAKRGCANFGHSCYGGMGKRSDITDEVAQDINQQEEDPALVFTGPRSEYKTQHQRFTAQQMYNLSPFLRQWLRSLRTGLGMRPLEEK